MACDDTVIARMTAALDAAQAGGLAPGPAAPLQRAVHWQRCSRRVPHGRYGADIARGALRLWSAGQELP